MMDAFMKQAAAYEGELKDSFYEKALQAFYIKDMDHPFMTIRCLEVKRWFDAMKGELPAPADASERLMW